MTDLWQARQVSIKIYNKVTVSTSATLLSLFSSGLAIETVCKNVALKEPEKTTEVVKLLGSTGGNQNSLLDEQAPDKAEFTGSLILNPNRTGTINLEQYRLTATTLTALTGRSRYNYASAVPTAGVALLIQFASGSTASGEVADVTFLLNDATVETLGGFKVDADGYAEQEVRITCAANNCWKEFLVNA